MWVKSPSEDERLFSIKWFFFHLGMSIRLILFVFTLENYLFIGLFILYVSLKYNYSKNTKIILKQNNTEAWDGTLVVFQHCHNYVFETEFNQNFTKTSHR